MRRPKRHKSKTQQVRQLKEQLEKESEAARGLSLTIGQIARTAEEWKQKALALEQQIQKNKKETESAQKIIERAATIDFRRCESSYYAIEVRFNGDFMGGISRHGEVQEYVADRVARDIRNQIASSKFIETAKANERREYMANVRRAYQGGEWIDGE